jgi:hypothetical protein
MGRRPTRGVWGSGAPEARASRGGSRPRSGGRQRRTGGVAGGEGVSGSVDGGFREAGGGGESRGAEDEGSHGRRRSGRMTAAAAEEDTTMTMAADQGRKIGKCWRGRVTAIIYRHTFSLGSCNES